ncbi:MAG TPA: radical SAM protein [Candidatus Dependentiae bacterium]|nr:radical SAM protein [Candidatus Dependentiae bacterium]
MKILLIAPNFTKLSGFMPSSGLAYLKSYMCKNTCHEIEILDEIKIDQHDIENKISAFKPDIIGITCLTIYRYDAIKAAELARKYSPDCKIVFGGPHPGFMYEQILNQHPFIDIVVIGEGEVTFKELVSAIDSDTPLQDVNGIAFINKGEVCVTAKRSKIQNLDELPFPAPMRDPMGLNDSIRSKDIGVIMSSRGCNYGCNFCSTTRTWGTWRGRSPRNVFNEMKMLVEEQGKKTIFFLDDEFTLDMDRIIKLGQILIDNKWAIP